MTKDKVKIPEVIPEVSNDTLDLLRKELRGGTEDPTKFTITREMNTKAMLDWFTEYENKDDVLRMNTIEVFCGMLPIVFPDVPIVKKIVNVFHEHTKQHKVNMTSKKRKREGAIVAILRGDNSIISSSDAKRFMTK